MQLTSRSWCLAFWTFILLLGSQTQGMALMGGLETELGYDSNPALQYGHEEASTFTTLSGGLTQGFTPWSHALITLDAVGLGRKYLRGGENESIINFHSDLTYISPNGTFQPTIFTRVGIYRSDLVPEDDRDVFGTGASLEYYPGIGWGVSCGISLDWLHYRRPYTIYKSRGIQGGPMGLSETLGVLASMSALKSGYRIKGPLHQMDAPWKDDHGSMHLHGHNMAPIAPPWVTDKKRNDRYESIYFSLQKDVIPRATASTTLIRERLFPSIKYEGFTRYGITVDITITLPQNLDLIATTAWKRARYRKTSLGNRTDYTKYISIELIKSYKKFGISIGYEHITNDSSFEIEDYRKDLVRTKLGFYF